MQSAYQKRDGDKLAKEIRELYFTQLYANVPEKSWAIAVNTHAFNDGEPMGLSYARVIELVRDFALERAAGRWS